MWIKPAGIALGMGREKLDPTPGVSRGGSWAESSGTFHGISAPGAVENLWKRTFLLEKKNFWDKLGFQRNFWESRAAFSFVFSREKCGFWLFEGAENSSFFHY